MKQVRITRAMSGLVSSTREGWLRGCWWQQGRIWAQCKGLYWSEQHPWSPSLWSWDRPEASPPSVILPRAIESSHCRLDLIYLAAFLLGCVPLLSHVHCLGVLLIGSISCNIVLLSPCFGPGDLSGQWKVKSQIMEVGLSVNCQKFPVPRNWNGLCSLTWKCQTEEYSGTPLAFPSVCFAET